MTLKGTFLMRMTVPTGSWPGPKRFRTTVWPRTATLAPLFSWRSVKKPPLCHLPVAHAFELVGHALHDRRPVGAAVDDLRDLTARVRHGGELGHALDRAGVGDGERRGAAPARARAPEVTAPGITMMMLVPKLAICCCTKRSAPAPTLTIAITDATPMIMPSMVSPERRRFRQSAREAARAVMARSLVVVAAALTRRLLLSIGCGGGTRRRRVGNDVAVAERDHPIRHRRHLRIVRDDDHRHAGRAIELTQHGHDLGRGLAVEVAGRLVGEQQVGLADEGARDRDPLLLAARQLARQMPGAMRDAGPREGGARARVLLGERQRPVVERQLDVLERGRPRRAS